MTNNLTHLTNHTFKMIHVKARKRWNGIIVIGQELTRRCVPIRLKLIPHPHEQVTELSHILEILEFEECILPSLCDYFT